MAEVRRQALLIDLDGTLYRGDGPVLTYARQVADGLSAGDAADYLSTMESFLRSGVIGADEDLRAATDGWEAVQRLAVTRYGVGPAELDRAFLASRRALGRPDCAVELPPGLLPALRELRPTTLLVLATNSPLDALADLLARLGVDGVLDDVVTSARKPAGLSDILRSLAERVDAVGRPWRIFSVGDHWHNDIEPARDFGAVTGYIDRFGRADGPADAVAPTMEGVLPAIRRWAGDPDTFQHVRRSV